MAFIFRLFMAGFLVMSASSMAGVERPDREEVIEEVSRFTGLAKDSVALALGDAPALMESMDETVFALKVVDKFARAKDTEAIADLYDYAFGKALDKLKDRLLPQAMNGLLLAFSVYKSSLEAMRDYYYIPKFDNNIYQAYKKARLEDMRRSDSSHESKETAFSRATTQKDSGYYVVKDKMYQRMIQAKGYNKDQIGPEMEKKLRARIDDFWRDRMELKLQQEQLRSRRDEMIATIWQNNRRNVDRLRKAVAQIEQPASPEKKKLAKQKSPEDELKQELKELKKMFKDLSGDKPKKQRTETPPPPAPAAQSTPSQSGSGSSGSSLNFKYKANSGPDPSVKSGQQVQSCGTCFKNNMDCVCGYDKCVCCAKGATCSAY